MKPLKLFFSDSFIIGRGVDVEFESKDAIIINGIRYRLNMGQRGDLLNWLALSFNDKRDTGERKAEYSIPHDGVGACE
jgi:hypothetical protein